MNRKPNPPRVLVVDDDPDTITILSRYLQREGFVAIEAPSGADCLRILQESPVDVILLDLMMPEMDGFQVCEALKRNPVTAEIPIILVTARDDIDARAEGIRIGVSEFLPKPFSRRQLIFRINAQLSVLEAGRAAEAALSRFAAGGEE
jgi:two-component system cell cycle response regulator